MDEHYENLIRNSSTLIHRERFLPILSLVLLVIISVIEGLIILLVQFALSSSIHVELIISHSYAFGMLFLLDMLTIYQFITINRWNAEIHHLTESRNSQNGSLFQTNWKYYSKSTGMVVLYGIIVTCCALFIILLLLAEQIKVKGIDLLVQAVGVYNFLAAFSFGIVSCYLILEIGYLTKWYRRWVLFRRISQMIIDDIPNFKDL